MYKNKIRNNPIYYLNEFWQEWIRWCYLQQIWAKCSHSFTKRKAPSFQPSA